MYMYIYWSILHVHMYIVHPSVINLMKVGYECPTHTNCIIFIYKTKILVCIELTPSEVVH